MQMKEALEALGQMTPRRFELLLACASLPGVFTVSELREHSAAVPTGSLLRDLLALETGGWLRADPPHTERRQGRVVRYSVARRVAGTVFHVLAAELDAGLTHSEPSRLDMASPPES